MTTKHNVSRAAELYAGDGNHPGVWKTQRRTGVRIGTCFQYNLGAPVALDTDGLATSQSPGGAGDLTLAANTMDVARNVTITSAGNDSGVTFTVTGTDGHGIAVVEEITGANAGTAAGAKAFGTVSSIAISGASAGTVTAGWGDVLGLPVRLNALANLLFFHAGDTEELASATVVVGDATAATATTGDVRGTITPNTACDGSTVYHATMFADGSSAASVGGVAQYAG